MSADPLLRFRSELEITGRCAYLNHAAVSPLPHRALARLGAVAQAVAENGERQWAERNAGTSAVRQQAARLLGARHAHEVAFAENTSAALSLVAQGLDWREGDNLVSPACEFPSNVYPWILLGEKGVELRTVPERDGRIDVDEMLSRVDSRTRVLALSWIEYTNGFRFDLAALGAFCRQRGILFVVDVIQGLGALQIDVERDRVDVAAAAVHKWLLGPEGVALLYISDRVSPQIRPTRAGWRSMRDKGNWDEFALDWAQGALRHESGTLNLFGIHALGGSLSLLLEAGLPAIETRVLALAERVAEGLAAQGLTLISSRRPGETSGIVAALHPRVSAEALVQHLSGHGIVTAVRGGRLRVSPHFYNSEDEIDRFLAAVAEV